jgi:hypothetical protein
LTGDEQSSAEDEKQRGRKRQGELRRPRRSLRSMRSGSPSINCPAIRLTTTR